jgi:hypothetical protein
VDARDKPGHDERLLPANHATARSRRREIAAPDYIARLAVL